MGNAQGRPGSNDAIQSSPRGEYITGQIEALVFVVDDDVSVRESLQNLLRSVGLRVETFSSASEFLTHKRSSRPACLILDVRLPGLNGLDLQQQLREANRGIPIIFITGHGDIPMSVKAIKAGAVEFLTKPFRDQDLLDAVYSAIGQDRQERQHEIDMEDLREGYRSLTPREKQVMQHVVRGQLNKQIAADIGVTEATVKLHRGRLIHKMRAQSLADLVRMAEKIERSEPH